jgi:hypothetical protein
MNENYNKCASTQDRQLLGGPLQTGDLVYSTLRFVTKKANRAASGCQRGTDET